MTAPTPPMIPAVKTFTGLGHLGYALAEHGRLQQFARVVAQGALEHEEAEERPHGAEYAGL